MIDLTADELTEIASVLRDLADIPVSEIGLDVAIKVYDSNGDHCGTIKNDGLAGEGYIFRQAK